jgi:Na+-driven multidrug efflux pump
MQDFTEGNIAKQIIDFTLPIMLGNVLMLSLITSPSPRD